MSKLAKRAYKSWVKEMDLNWRHNYPKWNKLNAHTQRSWVVAAEVFTELLR